MPSRPTRAKTAARNSKSNGRKTKKKDVFIEGIQEMADDVDIKEQSDEDLDADTHYKAEHYLRVEKKMSKAKFTAIDIISEKDMIPLKKKVMENPTNQRVKQQMLDRLRREQYPKWLMELKSGFNLLFYGVGSKKKVLEDFGKLYCCRDPDGVTICVKGFFEDLSMKQLMDSLCQVIVEEERKEKKKRNSIQNDKDLIKRAENVVRYLEEEGRHETLQHKYFYLIIHNITGKMLRKRKIQSALSVLADCKFIHLIASIDHIHGLLLWDRNDLSSFHWIYHDITTFEHYFAEMEFERDETIKITKKGADHGLEHIMASLTPQHRDIIQLLAEQQLENDGIGITHKKWYELCEEMMLVSNTLKFKAYITEFLDHNVIIEGKVQGNMVFTIPYSENVIRKQLIEY